MKTPSRADVLQATRTHVEFTAPLVAPALKTVPRDRLDVRPDQTTNREAAGSKVSRAKTFFRNLRIANKIILPLFVVLLVVVAVTAPFASNWIGNRIERSAEDSLRDNRRAVDLIIRAWEQELEGTVAHLADESGTMALDAPDHLAAALDSELERERLDFAIITLPDGQTISAAVPGVDPSTEWSAEDSFVRTGKGWALQATHEGKSAGGESVRVTGGRVLSNDLLEKLREAAGDKMLVALSMGDEIVGASSGHLRTMECNGCHQGLGIQPSTAGAGNVTVDRADMAGTKYLLLHTPFRLRDATVGTYTVMLPLDGVLSAQRQARNVIFGVGLLVFLVVTGIEALISRTITRPIARLAEVSKDIAGGNLGRNIEIGGTDEVGVLAGSMATMTQSLADQLQELGLLHQVSLATNSSLDLEHVLETLLDSAVKVLAADAGSIMLLDKSGQNLEVKVARGHTASEVRERVSSVSEGPAGWVVRNRRPLLLPDDLDARMDEGLAGLERLDISSSVSVPIETRDGVLGVLNLNILGSHRTFDRHTLTFATTLANHTAVAIDKASHHQEVNLLYSGLVRALAGAIDAKDRYTYGHSEMVAKYALVIGDRLDLDPRELKGLETAAYLHDIGKIGVRDAVLTKPDHLTPVERKVVETHPIVGSQILEQIVFPWPVVGAVRHHHERWDGAGYPDRLAGEDIPLHARILSVADAFDAMTSHRPYRAGRGVSEALGEVTLCAGSQFDPAIVAAFLEASAEVEETLLAARVMFPDSHLVPDRMH